MSGIIAQNVGRPSGLIKAAEGGGCAWVEIKSITASADLTISFVDGTSDVVLDSTYPVYCFKFYNLHPATNNIKFQYNFTTDGSNWNVSKATTFFLAYHAEDGSASTLAYDTNSDLANGTGYQYFGNDVGNDNDQGVSGYMYLFSPSDTTFVKHFMTETSVANQADLMVTFKTAGYCNTTSAITGVDFKSTSGNIDSGVIKLFGIKDS